MVRSLKHFKSSIALLIAFVMLLGLLPLSAAAALESNGFTDTKEHWAEDSIVKVVDEGLFNGINENTFNPNGAMTRGMFVTVLNRLAEKLDGPKVSGTSKAFSDVPSDAWYGAALEWAVKAKLTDGYGDGRFGPNDLLNREQITVLMIRFLTVYMGYNLAASTENVVFADDNAISSWAKKEVYQAQALQLIQGEKGNVFNPKSTATRAVVAVITERLLTQATELANEQLSPSALPSASSSTAPTATPAVTSGGGGGGVIGGGGGNGGSGFIALTDVKINRSATDITGQKVYSGDVLSVSMTPVNATTTVRWLVNGVEKSTASTYTVQPFDAGAVITAQVTGTGNYSGTLASRATGNVLAKVDLSETNMNNTPVIISSGSVYKDAAGNEVTIPEGAALYFEVNLNQETVPVNIKTSINEKLEDEFPGIEPNEIAIHYLSLDANLLLESADTSLTEIHAVGTTTLTLSKTNLGFSADMDISQHVFFINHTNVNGNSEYVWGEVVVLGTEQFVRFTLNGLSRIYIGNVPPLTITFDTQGGNEISPIKVKLGGFAPPVADPVKAGYFFMGWNAEFKSMPIYSNHTVIAQWLDSSHSVYKEYTYNVDRGIGTFEAILTGEGQEDYYANLSGYLERDYYSNTYPVSYYAYFSEQPYRDSQNSSVKINFIDYSSLKFVFTPFGGETYEGITPTVDASYWMNNAQHVLTFDSRMTKEGKIELVTTQEKGFFQSMATSKQSTYINLTVHTGERSQNLLVDFAIPDENMSPDEYQHVNVQTWPEVISALEGNEKIIVYYYGEDVTIDNQVTIGKHQRLEMIDANLTITDQGVVTVEGGSEKAGYLFTLGQINIESGGILTTNTQPENQGGVYYATAFANKGIFVASGGKVIVPIMGYLVIDSNSSKKPGLIIEKDASLIIRGSMYSYGDMVVNGLVVLPEKEEYNNRSGYLQVYGNLTINHQFIVAGDSRLNIEGFTTVNEKAEFQLVDGESAFIGQVMNKGSIQIQAGRVYLSKAGYGILNNGIVELDSEATIFLSGTVLVNSGTIVGSGCIYLQESLVGQPRYSSGIQYVFVEGKQTVSSYSRNKFVSDPEATVKVIIYSSMISGEGTVDANVVIQEVLLKEPEDK